ncbi:MAG: cystathionine beta-lyase [Xanthobacteraceae bacterium]|nr:cystathionine beta-lyase [Xanthobacteraceae bacterium]QYK46279.1 MAG: cystathionine beta-lyase [Xanthobacteraceae bacterium]
MSKQSRRGGFKPATSLVLAGRSPFEYDGFVNTPLFRGSTVLYETYDDLIAHRGRYTYGRRGTPTTDALASSLKELEGGEGVVLTPSGLSAISTALLSVTNAGDHVLITDSAYNPTRVFSDKVLSRYGVEVTYYDPMIGGDITSLFKPNTRAVFLEAPGSQSFEMQDVPAIVAACKTRGLVTLIDNTWATQLYFRPHAFGVDISIQAGTKYLGGHSDINLGTISANKDYFRKVLDTHGNLGINPGPEDVYLALRGMRTMAVRLERHMQSGLKVARWLQSRPEVLRVLHPALESDPGHAIWKRDFTGACGLFSFILKPQPKEKLAAFFDELSLFGMGYSWGGFESLIIPFDCAAYRTATKWNPGGHGVRIHIGLEDTDDLITDLEAGLAKLA